MLLLLFQSGKDRFALNVKQVVEIIPLVRLEKIPHAPDCVTGVFNFRGGPTPVLDLNRMISGESCAQRLSTRIILLDHVASNSSHRVIGLMAEQVTETIKCEKSEFKNIGVSTGDAPFLGGVSTDHQGMIQLIHVEHLIPDSVVSLDLDGDR
ncbi:MAG: purine-binding chemotaxis protein CheW [Methylococcales bacterium]|jgi:chemotaxis-related protein WspB|nr:purine-binding chemotaxis protein CheW [Methylococcales bacterium]MBT7442672.1 purine-binding chemotaxis protein CheW [Methylococcales bacterium]